MRERTWPHGTKKRVVVTDHLRHPDQDVMSLLMLEDDLRSAPCYLQPTDCVREAYLLIDKYPAIYPAGTTGIITFRVGREYGPTGGSWRFAPDDRDTPRPWTTEAR